MLSTVSFKPPLSGKTEVYAQYYTWLD